VFECYFPGACIGSIQTIGRNFINTRHLFGTPGLLKPSLLSCYHFLTHFERPCEILFVVLMTNLVTSFEPYVLYLFNFRGVRHNHMYLVLVWN